MKSVNSILILVALVLGGFADRALSAPSCPKGLTALLQEAYHDQDLTDVGLLSSLNARAIDPDFIRPLNSEGSVFEFRDRKGRRYVARLGENGTSDLEREQFAIAFAREAPGIQVPPSRMLKSDEADAVMAAYRRNPDEFADLKDNFPQHTRGTPKISVSVLAPGVTGTAALKKLGVSDPIAEIFESIARGKTEIRPSTARELLQRWALYTPSQKARFISDAKELFPPVKKLANAKVFGALLEDLPLVKGSRFQNLSLHRVRGLDPEIQKQIADTWIVYTVLGIPDLHPNNWLLQGDTVIGIDLAHPPQRVVSDSPLPPDVLNPYAPGEPSREMRDFLIDSVSPPMRQYLLSLTPARVREIGSQVGYVTGTAEMEDIIRRIGFLRKRW